MSFSDYDKANLGNILAGRGDWFNAELLRLIAKADLKNRRRLAPMFPEQVEAVCQFHWRMTLAEAEAKFPAESLAEEITG